MQKRIPWQQGLVSGAFSVFGATVFVVGELFLSAVSLSNAADFSSPSPTPAIRSGSVPTATPLIETVKEVASEKPPQVASKITGNSFKNSLGIEFVRIPAGTFIMGSPLTEEGRNEDEVQHQVTLTRDYMLGVYEVTLGQWKQFIEKTNYKTDAETNGKGARGYSVGYRSCFDGPRTHYTWRYPGFHQTDEHPVLTVTWNDATAFCKWLSQEENRVYRLPTEAEFEYACRAGKSTRYCFGEETEALIGNANIADALLTVRDPGVTWSAPWSDAYPFSAPVGSFLPNDFGLYDIHGNAWEWVADWYGPYTGDSVDPTGPATGEKRMLRGGSWIDRPRVQRDAMRYAKKQDELTVPSGFRLLLELSQAK